VEIPASRNMPIGGVGWLCRIYMLPKRERFGRVTTLEVVPLSVAKGIGWGLSQKFPRLHGSLLRCLVSKP
jgi:hypothetical protein